MTDIDLTKLACVAFGNPPEGFSPLTDDGDALRLAVKLRLTVDIGAEYVGGVWIDKNDQLDRITELIMYDPYAATRRAIVRVAASIGETK